MTVLRRGLVTAGFGAVIVLSACGSRSASTTVGTAPAALSDSPTVATASASTVAPPPEPSAPADAVPAGIVCKVTVTSGGSFYVRVLSASDHDFSVCDGGERLPDFNTDIFALDPTMDGRCVNDDTVDTDRAIISVFSTTAPADLAAAQALCDAHGWQKRAD